MKSNSDWKKEAIKSAEQALNSLHTFVHKNAKTALKDFMTTKNWTDKVQDKHPEFLEEAAKWARNTHKKGEKGLETFQEIVVWLEKLAEKEKPKKKKKK